MEGRCLARQKHHGRGQHNRHGEPENDLAQSRQRGVKNDHVPPGIQLAGNDDERRCGYGDYTRGDRRLRM